MATDITPRRRKKNSGKFRPKLQPMSPDAVGSHNFDDDGGGLGFGDILTASAPPTATGSAATTAEERQSTSMGTPDGPLKQPARFDGEKKDDGCEDKIFKFDARGAASPSTPANGTSAPEGKESNGTGAAQHDFAATAAHANAQVATAAQANARAATAVDAYAQARLAYAATAADATARAGCAPVFKFDAGVDASTPVEGTSVPEDKDSNGTGDAVFKFDARVDASTPVEGTSASEDKNHGVLVKDVNETVVDRLPTVSSNSWSTSSSSSSSSSDGSESEDEDGDKKQSRVKRLEELQREIRFRKRRIAKLLRGREGTAYARMIRSQEDAVNAQLLESFRIHDASEGEAETLKNDPQSKTAQLGRIKSILLEEYHHTLPAVFSLFVHCCAYITIYAVISKGLTWLSDVVIIYFTGWHISENNFDCTYYEYLFDSIVMILSLAVLRITGVIYDWNAARTYQRRLEFHFRNKWHLKSWDVRLMNYFLGDELRDEYGGEYEEGGVGQVTKNRKATWGPRLNKALNCLAFFACYKCADRAMGKLSDHSSNITEAVLSGLPSRNQGRTSHGAPDENFPETGFSHACANVASALENPYVEEMLKWMVSAELESDEVRNWVMNANKCGWTGPGAELDGVDVTEGGDADVSTAEEEENAEEDDEKEDGGKEDNADAGDAESYPKLFTQRKIFSPQDDEYIQSVISMEDYWELLGDPYPSFGDPVREYLFFVGSTLMFIGLLYYSGIPFLII